MWTHLALVNPQWTRVCLERSKDIPLHVEYQPSYVNGVGTKERNLESLRLVLKEFPRIRELQVDFGVDGYDVYLAFASCKDVSRLALESLSIRVPMHYPRLWREHTDAADVLSTVLANATNLRTLSTDGVWMIPRLPSTLRHLKVVRLQMRQAGDQKFNVLLDALRSTPLLETFEADDSSLITTRAMGTPARKVTLPHLKYIYLGSDISDTAQFLSHISFPRDTHVVIESEEVRPSDPKDLAQALSTWLNDPLVSTTNPGAPQHLKTYVVHQQHDGHDHTTFTFFAWKSNVMDLPSLVETAEAVDLVIPFSRDENGPKADLEVQFKLPIEAYRHRDRALRGFLGHLAVPEVQAAYIGEMRLREYEEVLVEVLAPMHNLRALVVCGRNGRAVPRLLQQDPPLFPVLETLRLETVRMIKPKATPQRFIEALAERQKNQLGLEKLDIMDCTNINGDDVRALKMAVREVKWDDWDGKDSASEGDSFDEEEEDDGEWVDFEV
ncbi:hypothetical protein EIP91_005995 [Steccherinum ochraceum]|uniref:F-box domain-containing protein n=1 Tax=Steccherinum ochraceum TaxID=92696 RepID=A0A4R0R989_9APHY|nr:hypothetical protein EIP91_005995 [Steccherinum ochraceum]